MCDGQIPEDWIHAPLGELGNITTGSTPPTSMPQNYGGDIPFVGPADLGDFRSITSSSKSVTEFGARQSRTLEAKAVLVSCIGILGKTGQADQLLTFNQQINAIAPYPSKVDPTFLYYLCNTLGSTLEKLAGLQVIPIVNKREFSTITRPVPRSLHEQKKIAKILDTLDTQIQKTEALIAKLEKIKEGLLHDLLTRGIDQNGQLRPAPEKAPELYKESALGLIPKEWVIEKLTERVALPKGQVSPLFAPYKTMILVAPDHIEPGTARLILKETAEEQNAISGKYLFTAGDVLYSKIRPYLRKVILADFSGLCSADMYPLRPSTETCPRFLLSVVLGHHFSRFAESVSMRSGFPKINRAELAEFSTAWPPFNEQREISNCMASAESKTAAELEVLCKLKDLKKGLMNDLLTGRVRVTPLLKDAV